jgi:hypothetical protein
MGFVSNFSAPLRPAAMVFRSTFLPSSHYAGKWKIPEKEQRNDLKVINDLGYSYATEADSAAKEAKLLLVLESFHGYLMKYLCMVIRGTVPPAGSHAGKDAKEFLRTLAPRGSEPSKALTDATCKTLHLAFKGHTAEDIYDTFVFCFVKAARQYDPHYAEKTKQVCEVISELPKQFTIQQLEARVGFDCVGILRSLVRKSLLASVVGKKKVVGYKLGAKWPAPLSYFKIGPIGFVYMTQMWFRYYLKNHIAEQMSDIETNEGFLQLGSAPSEGGSAGGSLIGGFQETIQSNADGNCINSTGKFRFMADRTLLDMPLDVSALNLDWVAETSDKLFTGLSVQQRSILFLYFHEEQSFKTIGLAYGVDAQNMRRRFGEILVTGSSGHETDRHVACFLEPALH